MDVVVVVADQRLRAEAAAAIAREPQLRLIDDLHDAARGSASLDRPDVVVVDAHRGDVGRAREFGGAMVLTLAPGDDCEQVFGLLGSVVAELRSLPEGDPAERSLASELRSRLGTGPPLEPPAIDLRIDEERVRHALDTGQPRMAFQPIVDLRDGRLVGIEALARFDPDTGPPPDVWFASAAACGLGIELETAAVRGAIAALADLPRDVYVSLNVSPESILSGEFAAALDGVAGHQVVLEITEHAPVADYGVLLDALARYRVRGVRVAIDDVGAGFASLRHVLRLEPDIVKLDMSITRGIERDPIRAKFVGGLIAAASAVSTIVVAEGIETEGELAELRSLGAPAGQGYLLGRPTGLAEALATSGPGPAPAGTRLGGSRNPPEGDGLAGARVLVVDDSPAHRLLVCSVLELEGFAVSEADTGAAAIEQFRTVEPDIVLLDLRLPDTDGFDVLDRIRLDSQVPVLFVTAAAAVQDRVNALGSGADDYILKPFSADELVARVRASLRRWLATGASKAPGRP